jgi:hypothetical protein
MTSAVLLAGCSNPLSSPSPSVPQSHRIAATPTAYKAPTPIKEKRFHTTLINIAKSTKLDPNYHRLALKTDEEKRWFKEFTYRLWDRQITRNTFIEEGVKRYPEHRYEFTYIANAFQGY